jgi:hypothetical protein
MPLSRRATSIGPQMQAKNAVSAPCIITRAVACTSKTLGDKIMILSPHEHTPGGGAEATRTEAEVEGAHCVRFAFRGRHIQLRDDALLYQL